MNILLSVSILLVVLTQNVRGSHRSDILTINNEDNATSQLFDYRESHPDAQLLTISTGQPVYLSDTNSLDTNLLSNAFLIDSIFHAVNARIPAREVFPKGTGGFGYFEVTNNVTKYTKAKLFEKIGKQTPVVARVATSQILSGGNDLRTLAARGLSVKFYTEEGNLDLLGIGTPVYFYRDPLLFRELFHALSRNPKTDVTDPTASMDFIILNPIALHTFLWAFSDFGLPRGYRHLNSFPIHTFQLYNKDGESSFVRFKFLSSLGYKSFSLKEAAAISGFDTDFFNRDFYNAIEQKKYPTWNLEMDVWLGCIDQTDFDLFDPTRIWPNGTYETVPIGRVVLNRTVTNHFAQIEQAAFNPVNLVPGIRHPPGKLFQIRVLAYTLAQRNRLGVNSDKIEVNCPLYANNYNRDGQPPVGDNGGDAPSYYPNSFNGPEPYYDPARPKKDLVIKEESVVHLEDSRRFYNEVLCDTQKQRLVDLMAMTFLRVNGTLQERFIELLQKVDSDLAKRYRRTLERLNRTVNLPDLVEEINPLNPNPFQ
ncbi:hypothetical protein JYU34_006286 [Plutella xylostella]|uniref:Catalase core domain-containing protein n=1 Tax=Plutella xylostella TaxID=51655 RepID=A0ABQ7QRV1_PLUXY|nr:hypothetical protein JYU34_006286 [Plutella xylostella]